MTINTNAVGDFEVALSTPTGYKPIGIIGIVTGQVYLTIVQYQIHADTNKLTATFRNIGKNNIQANVKAYVSFIRQD